MRRHHNYTYEIFKTEINYWVILYYKTAVVLNQYLIRYIVCLFVCYNYYSCMRKLLFYYYNNDYNDKIL